MEEIETLKQLLSQAEMKMVLSKKAKYKEIAKKEIKALKLSIYMVQAFHYVEQLHNSEIQ